MNDECATSRFITHLSQDCRANSQYCIVDGTNGTIIKSSHLAVLTRVALFELNRLEPSMFTVNNVNKKGYFVLEFKGTKRVAVEVVGTCNECGFKHRCIETNKRDTQAVKGD